MCISQEVRLGDREAPRAEPLLRPWDALIGVGGGAGCVVRRWKGAKFSLFSLVTKGGMVARKSLMISRAPLTIVFAKFRNR